LRWLPGDRVADRFVLVGRLAAGGMAEVHVAEMTAARGVRRRVAVKRIHPHLVEDPEFTTMFLDEARIAGQLAHPGLVPVIDVVEQQGELLLVLDYVPGWDLGAVLRAAPGLGRSVPVGVAVRIAQDVAEALAYVHEARGSDGRPLGVVHRDVSPANVLLAHDGTVRLLDFGVAKARERAVRTVTAGLKGKVAYMAPEQARAAPVDARTDLYALGLVLFEMLAGRRALDADGDVALLDLARAPTVPRVAALRPDVPAELDALVASLLSIDPADRPARAGDAARVLETARAALGGVSPADVHAFVLGVMGSDARPIDAGRGLLDDAIARAAGVELGAPGTAAAPASPPSPPLAHPDARSADETPTSGQRPLSGRRRRARRGIVALAILGAVAASGLGVLAAREGWLRPGPSAPARSRDEAPVAPGLPAAGKPGFLRVTSTPRGATVRLDGVAIGDTTPAVIESPGGQERTLELSLDDHEPWTLRIAAVPGRTTPVRATLTQRKGRLVVRSTPPGAEVQVAGRVVGTTPAEVLDLPRAATPVHVALAGHAPYETVAALDERPEVIVEAVLSRRVAMGALDVSATPWAEVWVGGRRLAESTPAMGLRLPAGDHLVTLTNPRLGLSAKRRVTIRDGARSSLVVRLQ
jgi:tRNA A-37 threonylcarbamoyl transferase component Bud32